MAGAGHAEAAVTALHEDLPAAAASKWDVSEWGGRGKRGERDGGRSQGEHGAGGRRSYGGWLCQSSGGPAAAARILPEWA